MRTSKIIWGVLVLSGMFCQVQAQKVKVTEGKKNASFEGWHLRSYETDGVYGAGVNQAYEYLKNREPKARTVVGIVDGGVDVTHEDLKDVLWRNPGEIPGNGIDDDGNGYVDDVHGWNFLGTPDGKQMEIGYTMADHEYMRLREKYENVDTTSLSSKERREYDYFQDVCEFSFICQAYREIAVAEAAVKYVEVFNRELKKQYPKRKNFEIKEFAPLLDEGETDAGRVSAYNFFLKRFQRRKNRLVWNEQFCNNRNSVVEEVKTNYEKLKDAYLTGVKNRATLGDDPENVKDRFYGNNNLLSESAVHGQHVGGIVGATRNNGIGVDGVADVDLMFVRVGPGNGDEHDKEVALCIRYAVDNGARVINMSFGKPFSHHNKWMIAAMKYAEKKGVLLVHAAGNDGMSLDVRDFYPNRYISKNKTLQNWIAVGSIDMDGNPASSSNYGKREVDLFAPGVNVYSTIYDKRFKYRAMSGTSMATPVVTGVIALIWNYFPELTAEEVKEAMLGGVTSRKGEVVPCPGNGEKVDFDSLCRTGGIVNALEAVKLAEKMYVKKFNR